MVKHVRELCFPTDADGATPGAAGRDTLLVCYTVKLAKGAKFARQTVSTHGRTVGVRVVVRHTPVALCVPGHAD